MNNINNTKEGLNIFLEICKAAVRGFLRGGRAAVRGFLIGLLIVGAIKSTSDVFYTSDMRKASYISKSAIPDNINIEELTVDSNIEIPVEFFKSEEDLFMEELAKELVRDPDIDFSVMFLEPEGEEV